MDAAKLKAILSPPYEAAFKIFTSKSLDEKNLQEVTDGLSYKLFHLDGSDIKSKHDLFDQFQQIMQFPDYFGHNWDALDECLRDLEWLPALGYVLYFSSPEVFINTSPIEFKIFLEVIQSAFDYWTPQQIAFQLIMVTD
jgi:hypothetical protein